MEIRGYPEYSEGNLSVAGDVALQHNQGCSNIGKHFKKEIWGGEEGRVTLYCKRSDSKQLRLDNHVAGWVLTRRLLN